MPGANAIVPAMAAMGVAAVAGESGSSAAIKGLKALKMIVEDDASIGTEMVVGEEQECWATQTSAEL